MRVVERLAAAMLAAGLAGGCTRTTTIRPDQLPGAVAERGDDEFDALLISSDESEPPIVLEHPVEATAAGGGLRVAGANRPAFQIPASLVSRVDLRRSDGTMTGLAIGGAVGAVVLVAVVVLLVSGGSESSSGAGP